MHAYPWVVAGCNGYHLCLPLGSLNSNTAGGNSQFFFWLEWLNCLLQALRNSGSFSQSSSGGPLWHQDALRLEHGPQEEVKRDIFIFNQNLLKRPCVDKKNNCIRMHKENFMLTLKK